MAAEICVKCRICDNQNMIDVFDLGEHALASRFPAVSEPDPPRAPLVLSKCMPISGNGDSCGLLQLKHTVSADEMYLQTYGYRSGLNQSMPKHLQGIVQQMLLFTGKFFDASTVVLDIGSNDGTTLSFYPDSVKRIGIDPTGSQFKQYYSPGVVLLSDFFTAENYFNICPDKALCVTSISMFYDLPRPLDFMRDVASVLDPVNGLWIMEQSYMPTMLERNSFDTICHEHLEYYALGQIQYMCERSGLRIVDVFFNDCNGGSFRVAICHKDASHVTCASNIAAIIRNEIEQGLNTLRPFDEFKERCAKQKHCLQYFLQNLNASGSSIFIYGASTKGNTLLQFYNIDTSLVKGAAERNPVKYGRRTPGTNIPIMSENEVRSLKPDFMLVLPWHFREEFLERENQFLEEGGLFLFPLPVVKISSPWQKVLLFGCHENLVSLHSGQSRHVFFVRKSSAQAPEVLPKNVMCLSFDDSVLSDPLEYLRMILGVLCPTTAVIGKAANLSKEVIQKLLEEHSVQFIDCM